MIRPFSRGWRVMTSRTGVREQRTGEFRARAQGSAGEPVLRIGSALPLIRLASGLLTALCLVIVWVSMTANGVLVLATIFAAAFVWSIGAFTRAFWVATATPEPPTRPGESD